MEVIGNRMEPNRLSIRLFGDVRTTTPKWPKYRCRC